MTATFTEALPATKSSPISTMRFTPSETIPGGGLLVIDVKQTRTTYAIVPYATALEGSAWHLAKRDEGTDANEESYDCFVCFRGSEGDNCDCRGFQRHGHCKHVDACRAIIDNGWDGQRQWRNPDQEVENTEVSF